MCTIFSTVLVGVSDPGCEALEADEVYEFEDGDFPAAGIVNGELAEANEFDGVVAIRGAGGICTGTLIDARVVLTAGHCVHLGDSHNIVKQPEIISVYSGPQREEWLASVTDVIPHPSWDGTIDDDNVDLAIIVLGESVEDHTKHCIRQDDDYVTGTRGIVVGYGRESSNGSSGTKRFGSTTVLKKNDRLVEVGKPTGPCLGDSGGPLFTQMPSGEYAIAGVSSFGGGSCDPNGNAYEVNVVSYRNWIESVVFAHTGRTVATCGADEDLASLQSDAIASQANTDSGSDGLDTDNSLADLTSEWEDDDAYYINGMGCTAAGRPAEKINLFALILSALF